MALAEATERDIARIAQYIDERSMTGPQLRAWRLVRGISQRKLGELLGISWNTIARWEREERSIQHGVMLTLALDALGAMLEEEDKRMRKASRRRK